MADNRDTFTTEIYVNNEQANDAIAEMTKQLTKLTDKYDDLAAKNEKLVEKTAKAKSAMEETAKALEGMTKGTDEYAKTAKKLDQQTKAYNELARQVEVGKHKMEDAAKEVKSMQSSIESARKGTEQFRKAMENLTDKSMQNLVRMQRQLKSELDKTKPGTKEWDELAKKYQDVTERMKALSRAQEGVIADTGKMSNGIGGLQGKLGSLGSMITAIPTILKGIRLAIKGITYAVKEVIEASQTMSDKWNNGMAAMKTTTNAFWAALSTGDWSVFNEGLDHALARAHELAEQMDLIGSYGISKGYMESKYLVEYQQAMTNARNQNLPDAQRNEWADIAEQRLKEYNEFLNDENEATMKALRLNFETLKGLTFDSQEEFEIFLDRLYKDAFVNRDKEVNQAKKDFEEFVALRQAELAGERETDFSAQGWIEAAGRSYGQATGNTLMPNGLAEALGNSIADKADATTEAFAMIEEKYGHLVAQLLKGIEIVDEDHKKLIGTYASHQNSIRQVDKSSRQLNAVRAQLKIETGAYAQAVREADEEEKAAMTEAKKRYADGLIDKTTYEAETTRIAREARQRRKEANLRYMNEDLAALKRNEQMQRQEAIDSYMRGEVSLEEHRERLAQITQESADERLEIERRYGEDLAKIEEQQYEDRIRERERQRAQYEQAFQKALQKVEKKESEQKLFWKQQYAAGLINKQTYEAKIAMVEEEFLKQKMETAMRYGKDTDQFMSQLLDRQIARMEKAKALLKEEMDEMARTYIEEHPDQNPSDEQTRNVNAQLRRQGYRDVLGTIPGESDEDFDKRIEAYENFQEQIMLKASDIRASITEETARKEYETELMWIEKLHEKGLLSEEEYAKSKLKLKLNYAEKEAQQVSQLTEMASNFVTALKEAETQKLEAEYQKQLTAAGDNAEQREQIEAEYEQKKLDLQKKYADVDMAINIAKAIASGALAAVEAFAAAGGNPVLGAVFAALIAVTTAAEVASIIAQRNAIKNMSVNNAGSSSVKTGTRTINEGYAEGGYTEDHTTLTTVGERGREWVAPHWMLQKHPVHFANLERYRKAGSHGRSGSMSTGFADGGFTTGNTSGNLASNAVNISDIELAVENAINRSLANGHIRAFLVRQDLTDMDNQTKRFKSMTNRG